MSFENWNRLKEYLTAHPEIKNRLEDITEQELMDYFRTKKMMEV